MTITQMARMRKVLMAVAVAAALLSTAAHADEKAQMTTVIEGYVADMGPESPSFCTSDAVVIDGTAPFVWYGPHACEDWRKETLALAQKLGIASPRLELGPPLHVMVSGNQGYAAFPATLVYAKDDKVVSLPGNTLTLAMRKIDGVWKIASWAFTDR
jgi:hypothetical protein